MVATYVTTLFAIVVQIILLAKIAVNWLHKMELA
jgi:hypothetical protein